jgi:hypothetical protein
MALAAGEPKQVGLGGLVVHPHLDRARTPVERFLGAKNGLWTGKANAVEDLFVHGATPRSMLADR